MWRIRRHEKQYISNHLLRVAIMKECGTSLQCYKDNRAALIKLGWLRTYTKTKVALTGADLDE